MTEPYTCAQCEKTYSIGSMPATVAGRTYLCDDCARRMDEEHTCRQCGAAYKILPHTDAFSLAETIDHMGPISEGMGTLGCKDCLSRPYLSDEQERLAIEERQRKWSEKLMYPE